MPSKGNYAHFVLNILHLLLDLVVVITKDLTCLRTGQLTDESEKKMSETMCACKEESARFSPKPSKLFETNDAHVEDTECQPSLNEFPDSGCGPNKLVVNSSGTENPDPIVHSDSDLSLSDGDWTEMLSNFDNEDYFDALSDITSDENAVR